MTTIYGIMLSGQQGSGKTTTSNLLRAYAEKNGMYFFGAKFADTLYEMHDAVREIALSKGIPMPKKDGKFLQYLGTDWGRNNFGENVWVDAAKKAVANRIESIVGVGQEKAMIVIDDCRFPNELTAFPEFLTVRLVADRDTRKARTDAWRDTENHPSETSLDGYEDKFDLVLDTVSFNPEKIVATILDMAALKEVKYGTP